MGTLADLDGKKTSSGGSATGRGTLAQLGSSGSVKRKPGSGGGLGGILDDVSHAVGGAVGTTLNTLDLGRAAVLATATEAGDSVGELLGGDAKRNSGAGVSQHGGFSLKDIVENTKHHVGTGQYLEAGGATRDLPLNVKRALGFAGDVAADPLTYVTAGTTAAGKGGQLVEKEEVARRLINLSGDAVERLGGREAVDQLANDVLKKGGAQLSKDAAEEVGVRNGVRFGTKRAALVIPHTEKLTELAGEAGAAVKSAVRDKLPEGLIEGLQAVPTEGLRRAANQGGRLGELEAFGVRESAKQASRVAARGGQVLQEHLAQLAEKYKDVPRDEIRRAIETGDGEIGKDFGDLFEAGAKFFEDATGKTVNRRNNYLTHILTPEGREALAESGKRLTEKGKAVFEHARGLEGTIEDINAEMLSKWGKDGVKLFEDNPLGVADSWVKMVRRAAHIGGIEKQLADRGLASIVNVDEIRDALESNAKNAAKAAKKAAKGGALADHAAEGHAVADDLREAAGAGDNPIDLTADPTIEPVAQRLSKQADRAGGLADDANTARDRLVEASRQFADNGNPTNADLQALDQPQTALDKARGALGEASSAVPQEATQDPRLGPLVDELGGIDDKIAAAKTEAAEANKALEFPPQATPGKDVVDAAIKRVDTAEKALADLVDRKDFLRDETEHLSSKTVAADSPERAKAMERVAKAEQVLSEKTSAFDVARQSMLGDVSERATANRAKLAELDARIADAGEKAHLYEQVAAESRRKADELFAAVNAEPDPILRQIAKIEALSAAEEAKATELLKQADVFRAADIPIDAATLDRYHEVLRQNFVDLASDRNMWAHPEVANAVDLLHENLGPQKIGKILKTHDAVLARWKAWQLVSPGYHGRNFLTAMFSNGLAGMDGAGGTAYFDFGRATRAFERDGITGVEKKMGAEYARAWEQMIDNKAILFDDVESGIDAADALQGTKHGGKASANPLSMDFAPVKANFWLAGKVEKTARGPLFLDGILNGLDADAAIDRVIKFHFDYQALGRLEKKYAKRVIPFYTWQRFNFPVQLEMMAKRPGMYTRYLHAKRNIELGTDEDSVVPEYFKSLLGIRTPFKVPGKKNVDGKDASVYLTPDLPFVRLSETFNSDQLLAQLSPLVKTPLELSAGKQFFSGIPFKKGFQKAPTSPGWTPVLAVLSVADGKLGLPKVERGADGSFYIDEKGAYEVEQFLPILSRMRRNAPSEQRYQDRELTTWLSTFFGTGARTNSVSEQEGELRRRQAAIDAYAKKAKELGY